MHSMTLPLVYGSKQSHYRVHCDVFTHNMSGMLALVIDFKKCQVIAGLRNLVIQCAHVDMIMSKRHNFRSVKIKIK